MTFREKLNSRKLAMATGCIFLATVLLIARYLDGDNFVTIVITVAGAYMATQAYVDTKNGKADYERT